MINYLLSKYKTLAKKRTTVLFVSKTNVKVLDKSRLK